MKYLNVLLLLFCLSCSGQSDVPSDQKPEENLSDPDLIIEVYDALEVMEDPTHSRWNECFLKVLNNHEMIWTPAEEVLNRLVRAAVFKPGDSLKEKDRKAREEALARYRRLKKSLVKVVMRQPDNEGVSLLIRHLDEDIPEFISWLEARSSRPYGKNAKAWTRWFIASRFKAAPENVSEVRQAYRKGDTKVRQNLLKTFKKIGGELKVNLSTVADDRLPGSSMIGRVESKDIDNLRLQAMAVFVEALKDEDAMMHGQATAGLIQMGDIVGEVMLEFVEDDSIPLSAREKGYFVLGRCKSIALAESICTHLDRENLRPFALKCITDMQLNSKYRERLLKVIRPYLMKEMPSETLAAFLATVILLGETDRFPLLLQMCPESKKAKYIDNEQIVEGHWRQVQRVAKTHFQRLIGQSLANMPEWERQRRLKKFDFKKEFHKYCQKNNLNLLHENWLKWWKNKLNRI